jgi:hypothetical protein
MRAEGCLPLRGRQWEDGRDKDESQDGAGVRVVVREMNERPLNCIGPRPSITTHLPSQRPWMTQTASMVFNYDELGLQGGLRSGELR